MAIQEIKTVLEPITGVEAGVFNAGADESGALLFRCVSMDGDYPNSRIHAAQIKDGQFERLGEVLITYANRRVRKIAEPRLKNSAEDVIVYRKESHKKFRRKDRILATVVGLEIPPYFPGEQFATTFLVRVSGDFKRFKVLRPLTPEDQIGQIDDRHVVPFDDDKKILFRPQKPNVEDGRYYDAFGFEDKRPSCIYIADTLKRYDAERLIEPREEWESGGIGGVCAAPVKRWDHREKRYVWRFYYIGKKREDPDDIYSVGVAELDADDPRKVLRRSKRPILAPGDDWNRRFPLLEVPGKFPERFGKENVLFIRGYIPQENGDLLFGGANDRFVIRAFIPEEKLYESFE